MTTKTTKNPATKVEATATQPATKPATKPATNLYRVRFDVKANSTLSHWLVDVYASSSEEAIEIAKINWKHPNHMFHVGVRKIPARFTKPRYDYHVVDAKEFDTFGFIYAKDTKVEPATKVEAPATKVEPATQPATKVEPATQPAKTPVVTEAKVSMRVVKGSSWDDLKDCPMWVNHKDSKSSVGQFIIEFFSDKDFTGEELAQAFMNQFKTKTGIKPDEKWARRNVKLFVDKGVIMCEIEPEQDAKD